MWVKPESLKRWLQRFAVKYAANVLGSKLEITVYSEPIKVEEVVAFEASITLTGNEELLEAIGVKFSKRRQKSLVDARILADISERFETLIPLGLKKGKIECLYRVPFPKRISINDVGVAVRSAIMASYDKQVLWIDSIGIDWLPELGFEEIDGFPLGVLTESQLESLADAIADILRVPHRRAEVFSYFRNKGESLSEVEELQVVEPIGEEVNKWKIFDLSDQSGRLMYIDVSGIPKKYIRALLKACELSGIIPFVSVRTADGIPENAVFVCADCTNCDIVIRCEAGGCEASRTVKFRGIEGELVEKFEPLTNLTSFPD